MQVTSGRQEFKAPMRFLIFSVFFVCVNLLEGIQAADYNLALKNIYLSHGVLTPAFSPDIFSYRVPLQHAHDEIAITPEIDQTRKEYEGGENHLPFVTIHWEGHMDEKPESASVAIRKQVDLPDDKSTLSVEVRVSDPADPHHYLSYYVSVEQSQAPLTVLKSLSGSDEWGNTVLIEPITTQDDATYIAYVHPDANTVMLTTQCASPDWVTINGKTVANGLAVPIPREKHRHKQTLEVACGEGHSFGQLYVRRYMLGIVSDYPKSDLSPPPIFVDDVGLDCKFDDKRQAYDCPNPKSHDGKTRVIGFINPTVRYTVESPDKAVEVRVLDQLPTIPFTYRSDLNLIATAGRETAVWPLHFNAPLAGGSMRVIGWILSVLLLLLLLALGVVLSLSNMFGLGSPWGASEIANTLTFICQYFCFANFLRGSNLLTDMTESLKWTTLFIPLPWETRWKSATAALSLYRSYSPDMTHYPGDVNDVHNAYGCLFWSMAIFVMAVAVHGIVTLKFVLFEPNSTFPHRLLMGHWESRILHLLAFPAVTAASMIIATRGTALVWKALALATISALLVWVTTSFFLVRNAVVNKKVTWVWNASVREDGELEDESGYWSDVICDQLNTQPVNRSLFKSIFPWQWISTVADVEQVNISPQLFSRGDDMESVRSAHTLYPARAFRDGTDYPMGKNPKTVEAYRTRAPGLFCPGQRLISGLLRTQWLDMLFTFEGLSKFHTEVVKTSGDDFVVPLTVKTCQLQGPITTGRYCFFFDGARVPFIRVLDTSFKMVVGMFLGVALATKSNFLDAICLGAGALLAFGCLFYAATTSPYSRRVENWLLCMVFAAVGLSAVAFGVTALTGQRITILADIFLWFTAIVCIILALYSCVVTFSVFSAISCAPLEETRFLEKLANCSVTISDHGEGWAVDMPAYNKYGARDVKAQCNIVAEGRVHVVMYPSGEEPSMEFDVEEVKQACRTGALQHPVVVVYAPGSDAKLSYRYANVYDRNGIAGRVSSFLAADMVTRSCADVVGRQVAYQVESRGRDRTVVAVTVIPPKGNTPVGSKSASHGPSRSQGGTRSRSRTGSSYYGSMEMSSRR